VPDPLRTRSAHPRSNHPLVSSPNPTSSRSKNQHGLRERQERARQPRARGSTAANSGIAAGERRGAEAEAASGARRLQRQRAASRGCGGIERRGAEAARRRPRAAGGAAPVMECGGASGRRGLHTPAWALRAPSGVSGFPDAGVLPILAFGPCTSICGNAA